MKSVLKIFLIFIWLFLFQIQAESKTYIFNEFLQKTSQDKNSFQSILTHIFIQPEYYSSYMLHFAQFIFQNKGYTKSTWPPSITSNTKYQVNLSLGYQHPFSRTHGWATSEPIRFGWQDIMLYLHYPLYSKIEGILGVTYPASALSRARSLKLASTLGIARQWSNHYTLLKVSGLITGFLNKYKSTSLFANPLLAWQPSLYLQTHFRKITTSIYWALSSIYDYDFTTHFSQQLKLQTSYAFRNFQFFVAYLWNNHSRNLYININQFLVFEKGFHVGWAWKV